MDQAQAEALVETHGQAVYRLAYARTLNRADAQDITQEAFLRLVAAAPDFRDAAHCRAWLLRVAMNCAADLRRREKFRRHVSLEEADQLAAPADREGDAGVLEAVGALPEPYRAVVHLFYYEGMSTAEIARVLGLREGTVRVRLSRARDKLRILLDGTEGAHV